jgi:hypothetical protein
VGAPIPGVKVHVLDEQGRAVTRGRTGEVVIEGPNVMVGYWRRLQDTERAVDGLGRLHTGDLGWFDDEGDLHLAGRVDDLIKSAGERIAPQEIERALRAVPGIRECVVVGAPDPSLGQRIEAHVVLEMAAAAAAAGQGAATPRSGDPDDRPRCWRASARTARASCRCSACRAPCTSGRRCRGWPTARWTNCAWRPATGPLRRRPSGEPPSRRARGPARVSWRTGERRREAVHAQRRVGARPGAGTARLPGPEPRRVARQRRHGHGLPRLAGRARPTGRGEDDPLRLALR